MSGWGGRKKQIFIIVMSWERGQALQVRMHSEEKERKREERHEKENERSRLEQVALHRMGLDPPPVSR